MTQIKTKLCPRCKIDKNVDDYYVHKKDGTLHIYCKKCQIAMTAKWQREHRDRHNLWCRNWNKTHKPQRSQRFKEKVLKGKIEVLTYYGNGKLSCVMCGFEDIRALSIDHINEDGASHRRQNHHGLGFVFYRWLQLHNYPSGYQTLCMNCQWIKRRIFNEVRKGADD